MSRERILIALGVLIALSPFVGLPYAWLMVFLPIAGLLATLIGVTLDMRRRARLPQQPESLS